MSAGLMVLVDPGIGGSMEAITRKLKRKFLRTIERSYLHQPANDLFREKDSEVTLPPAKKPKYNTDNCTRKEYHARINGVNNEGSMETLKSRSEPNKNSSANAVKNPKKKERRLNMRLERLRTAKKVCQQKKASVSNCTQSGVESSDSGIDAQENSSSLESKSEDKERQTEQGCCSLTKDNLSQHEEDKSVNVSKVPVGSHIGKEKSCKRRPKKAIPESKCLVAMDCEFVGVGPKRTSALGRCSIVDFNGDVLCDVYARPREQITDYRTRWSGIRKRDMKTAVPLDNALNQIRRNLQGKIVIGHALHNDFGVLGFKHPASLIRDTCKCILLRKKMGTGKKQPVSLKILSQKLLGLHIQAGEHCSVEDSRAALNLYKLVQVDWEKQLRKLNKSNKHKELRKQKRKQMGSLNNKDFLGDEYWPAKETLLQDDDGCHGNVTSFQDDKGCHGNENGSKRMTVNRPNSGSVGLGNDSSDWNLPSQRNVSNIPGSTIQSDSGDTYIHVHVET